MTGGPGFIDSEGMESVIQEKIEKEKILKEGDAADAASPSSAGGKIFRISFDSFESSL